jgi:hypothetical protein
LEWPIAVFDAIKASPLSPNETPSLSLIYIRQVLVLKGSMLAGEYTVRLIV